MCNVLAAIVTGPACDTLTPIEVEQESKKQSPSTPAIHQLTVGHVRLTNFS